MLSRLVDLENAKLNSMAKMPTPPFDIMPPGEFDVPGCPVHARLFRITDADKVLQLVQDDAVQRYVPWAKSIHDHSTAAAAITRFEGAWNRKVTASYLVELNGKFVGYCRLWRDPVPGYYELGSALLPEFRGQGIATKLVSELIKITKNTLHGEGMVAYVSDMNKASQATVKKLGFRKTDEFDDGDRRYLLDFS